MSFSIQPLPDIPDVLVVTNHKTEETQVYTVEEAKDLVVRLSETLGLRVYTRMNQLEYRRREMDERDAQEPLSFT